MTMLADRVTAWVADHPGRTAEEIALAVRVRRRAVEEVLASPVFSAVRGPVRSITYRLADGGVPGRPTLPEGKPAVRESDGAFLLRVLADGEPHTLNEILKRSFMERGCGLTVHSRAADLRKHGHDIRNWKDGERGDGSWYRLVGAPLCEPSVAEDPTGGRVAEHDGHRGDGPAHQLSIEEAA